ncbi:MAG: DUF1343 domain-containing protein [Flavobacteriaceae bacterium]|nr:DUF1343 domain-containing protein [Flavobacteriaceae bacterium]
MIQNKAAILKNQTISIRKSLPYAFLVSISLLIFSCKPAQKGIRNSATSNKSIVINSEKTNRFSTGADNYKTYFSLLKGKKLGVVTNQTGVVLYDSIYMLPDTNGLSHIEAYYRKKSHLVDFLIKNKINIQKIYAPEHGFRGTADAGEHVIDGKDAKTGIPIISLYGENRKPKPEQLEGIDVLIFDLQDVGVRFYTYISTLHYIMEACSENNIQLLVLDRPNPNISIVDGPILEKEFTSFVGMHPIPLMHGMTIGEYAQMINGENWLKNEVSCDLKIIACAGYNREMKYSLPEKPSPNLPNDQAINLYPSLCLFEGTSVSVGRGTEKQFQIYGSPYLPKADFSFIPMPNFGAKEPVYNGVECYGEDLTSIPKIDKLELKWLLKAYAETADKTKFFNPFFTKLAGTKKLQEQIEAGLSEDEIRESWKSGLNDFKKMRKPYLIY